MSRILIPFALGLAVSCTSSIRVGSEAVDARYATGGGEWSSGGGITAVARVFERGGATVVCGAWTTDRQSVLSTQLNEDVIASASVYAGETRVAQNLAFMARTAYSDNIAGAQANCVASPKPWNEAYATVALRFRFPQMEFILDEEGGTSVRFRETLRPTIIR